jgi:hypothetical protein
MPSISDDAVAAVARLGSFLAAGVALWCGAAALGIPFWLFVPLWLAACLASWWFSRPAERLSGRLPLVPLTIVLAILLSPVALLLHGASGPLPHWFARSDDAYTLLIARGLRLGFPSPDLSWAGQAIRYHLGTPLLVDLLSRLTSLPVHTIYYGLLPIVMKIILAAAVLEAARRFAPDLRPSLRVWIPLAVSGLFTMDLYAVLWHLHDLVARGAAAFTTGGMPLFALQVGLFTQPAFDSGWLAVPLLVILIATWQRITVFEQACLLFAVFLVKPQVFLAGGAAWGILALLELRRRNWRPFIAGAIALAAAIAALPLQSTYGSLAHMTIGCGAECLQLIEKHHLSGRLPRAALLPLELAGFVIGFHIFAFVLLRRRRLINKDAGLALLIASAGLVIAFVLRLVPTPLLRQEFLGVYAPIADRLFMPLGVYLDRIFDVAVDSAYDAFIRILPLVVIPIALRPPLRRSMAAILAIVFAVSIWSSSFLGAQRWLDGPKEIAPDAANVLRAIPTETHAILTNELAYDDVVERHLPLLNIWAPLYSGRQFWASAFMFEFQYPDAARRLQQTRWFFESASAEDRNRFADVSGIDALFVRRTTPALWPGWVLIARDGRYDLYRRQRD